MTIYLQSPDKTQIKVFQNENEIGVGFIDWKPATQQEINDYLLNQIKQEKLVELDNFHDSDEVRNFKIKTPKNLFTFSTLSGSRDLLVEQIDFNRNGIESGLIAPEKAGFLFFQAGKSEFISFNNLKFIYAKLMELVNTNFAIKLSHKTKINAIVNLEDLKKYDFKKGYIINQQFEIK